MNEQKIEKISTTDNQKKEIHKAIQSGNYAHNEKVWTYFVAHLILNSKNKKQLLEKFLGGNSIKEPCVKEMEIWYEAQPISPRKGVSGNSEGNTCLDMSFGAIKKREETDGGIEFSPKKGCTWACFIEAKVLSDCSTDVSYDPFRNQITRVIENLVTFQNAKEKSSYPNPCYFTLLTPRAFKERPYSKLYGYKYFEYHDWQRIEQDFELCCIDKRKESRWEYPKYISKRLSTLKLNWVTYEEIIEQELGITNFDLLEFIKVKNRKEQKEIMDEGMKKEKRYFDKIKEELFKYLKENELA